MCSSKSRSARIVVCLFLASVACTNEQDTAVQDDSLATGSRPNILLIVADDVGYSDVGVFGSEISTPNIDALATEGVTLTQFHVFPNCGPTRGAMMTGVDPHRAGPAGDSRVVNPGQPGSGQYDIR